MLTRWPSIIVVMLGSLLTFTTSASAECAWLLWMAITIPTLPDQGPHVVAILAQERFGTFPIPSAPSVATMNGTA